VTAHFACVNENIAPAVVTEVPNEPDRKRRTGFRDVDDVFLGTPRFGLGSIPPRGAAVPAKRFFGSRVSRRGRQGRRV
jgi:hypothetical protein